MSFLTDNMKPRLLTGDTPTGKLHLGHWVGSVANRVKMQDTHSCFFVIANYHAFSTKFKEPKSVHESVINITMDYLAAGIDPRKSAIFVQSDIPAIQELTFIFSMLVTHERLLNNPTLKAELRDKAKNTGYPFGFVLYPLGQAADILAFKPEVVPVGEDQMPHLELTRLIARKFNDLYGEYFPIPKTLLGKEKRLIGIDPPSSDGTFRKMSKSFNNAIFLSDTTHEVQKKVKKIYTDPARTSPTTPGKIENNPLWMFHDALNSDLDWVQSAKKKYVDGAISDAECKHMLFDVIENLLTPMRERRKFYENHMEEVVKVLKEGAEKANVTANHTLKKVKELIFQNY